MGAVMAKLYPNRNEAILATIKVYSKRIQKKCPKKIQHSAFLDAIAHAMNFATWMSLAESIRHGNSPIPQVAGWLNLSPENPKFLEAMRRLCEALGVSREFGTKELAVPFGRIISYLCHVYGTEHAKFQEVDLETTAPHSMTATSVEFPSAWRSEAKKAVTVTIKHRKKLDFG